MFYPQAFPHSNSWETWFLMTVEWPSKYPDLFSGALELFPNLSSPILPWHCPAPHCSLGTPQGPSCYPSPPFLSLGTLCPQTLSRGLLPTVPFLQEQSEATRSQAPALRELGEGRRARGHWPRTTYPTCSLRVTRKGDSSLCSRSDHLEVRSLLPAPQVMRPGSVSPLSEPSFPPL